MNHVVLLGDSIFDNAAYVPKGSAVIDQLRERSPDEWKATLLAVDSTVADDVTRQIRGLPEDATHLVISTGGNNALLNGDIVEDTDHNAAEGWAHASVIQEQFAHEYREMLSVVLAKRLPTVLCTIYDTIRDLPQKAITALSIFNDVILREGFRHGLPMLDLRLICNEAHDYSDISSIEPSEVGGVKIVRGIIHVLANHDFSSPHSVVYTQ